MPDPGAPLDHAADLGESVGDSATPLAGDSVVPFAGDPVAPASAEAPKRRRPLWVRLLVVLVLIPVVLGAGVAIAAGIYYRSVSGDVDRVDAFDNVPEADRPTKDASAGDAMNFLVLGSDTRNPENTSGSRSDTIIVLHVSGDKKAAQMVSIPRDTWVHVPKSADGKHGDTNAKINAAYAWGGVPLTVQTVEDYTGIRIDHVVMVDFSGFKEIIDALGGVEITVDQPFVSTHSLAPGGVRQFKAGTQTMDGDKALDYARERYAFADGDFARIQHQQDVIKAVLNKAASSGTLSSPTKLNKFIRATAGAVKVDDTLNLLGTATDLRGLRGGDLAMYTSPSSGTAMKGDQSVVLPDTAKAKKLFDALRTDNADAAETVMLS
ncbi:LCP family protein [Actinoplanes sp. NPDC051851]|uniref:LCP family protein n=1 Tax=Actinoplanes sp. NPDC051851 TaxID=3154753 RepID=UPI003437AB1B